MTGGKNSGIIGLRNWQQHDYYNGVDLHPISSIQFNIVTGVFRKEPLKKQGHFLATC
jgi:hypothetical protein